MNSLEQHFMQSAVFLAVNFNWRLSVEPRPNKVDLTDIVINNPSELVVVIPALEAGKYKLQIITQFTTATTLLKTPRATIFDKILTV